MKKINFKDLETPFVNSIISAMQLTYELKALHHYQSKYLHLDTNDFNLQQKKYEQFIQNLDSFIKDNKITTNVVDTIQEQVAKIDLKTLLEQYSQFANLLPSKEYQTLRKRILNLEAELDCFISAYFKMVEGQHTINENKTIQSLSYCDLIRGADNLVGAYTEWDHEIYLQVKAQEASTSL